MSPEAFRALALSLTGSHEEPHFERTSFRVGKKIFATMSAGPDAADAMIPVKPVERCLALLASDPETFIDHGGWTRRFGSLGVRLGRVRTRPRVALIEELAREAWARVSKKGTAPRAR